MVAVEGDGSLLLLDRGSVNDAPFVLKAEDGPWRAFRDIPRTHAPRYQVHTCSGHA
jgi:hypothetical protein